MTQTKPEIKTSEISDFSKEQKMKPTDLAILFHKTYERLAPEFGYDETREETRTFDSESANGRLMIAVCAEVLREAAMIKSGSTIVVRYGDWE